jgi:hypothetical protein
MNLGKYCGAMMLLNVFLCPALFFSAILEYSFHGIEHFYLIYSPAAFTVMINLNHYGLKLREKRRRADVRHV